MVMTWASGYTGILAPRGLGFGLLFTPRDPPSSQDRSPVCQGTIHASTFSEALFGLSQWLWWLAIASSSPLFCGPLAP